MKKYKKFLEEVTIHGNPGIPGEGNREPDDSRYLSDIERRAKDRMNMTGRENPMQLGQRMMQLLESSLRMTRGKERELEQLAHDIIMSNYADILEGVELDIKLVRGGREINDFMESGECCDNNQPKFREIRDEELRMKIHKAKLGNNIIQGEAKNTKHILHTDEVKDGLKEIFGDDWRRLFDTWDELTKTADKMDWIIPIDVKSNMMEQHPEGLAGAVKVEWEPKPQKEDNTELANDMIDDLLQNNQLNDEDIEKFQELVDEASPIIRARGIDFPMLLHEAVKGIYELIAAIALPPADASEDELTEAETIKLNVSSFEDEAEDFRTGPEIAADFRDFINQNPDANYTPNMRAYIFGKMMDPKYMNAREFLALFRGILNKTPQARQKIDSMIAEIIQSLKNYDLGIADDNIQDDFTPDNYNDDSSDDLSKLSQRELQDMIDTALDEGDYDEVHRLTKYLKEGRNLYIQELEMIREKNHYRKKNKK